MTVRRALETATRALQSHRAQARLEADLLLAHCLDKSRSWLIAHDRDLLSAEDHDRYQALCARAMTGEPLAYITGEKEFWSLTLHVGPSVLVPRPDTECLVEAALEVWPEARPVRAVDLGTGSGAIALALATEHPGADIWATDISEDALAFARENAARYQLDIRFLQGAWYAPLQGERFDLIVANPPYVADGDPHLTALSHEPSGALTAGPDGMDDLAQIIADAPAHLCTSGWLLVEHGADQGERVRRAFHEAGFLAVDSLLDLGGRERVTRGRWP